MENKVDRRIRRTQKALQAGLIELLKDKSINEITIRELCDKIDINRSTFYLHYTDIYELLKKLEEQLINELLECFDKHYPIEEFKKNPSVFLTDLFRCLGRNGELALILMGANGDKNFLNKLKKMIQQSCILSWEDLYKHPNTAYYEYLFSFVIEGYLGLFRRWIESGIKETPQEMAYIAQNIVTHGIAVLDKDMKCELKLYK